MNKHNQCPLCNTTHIKNFRGYYKKNGLMRCSKCGFVFMENIPGVEELNNSYGFYSYEKEEEVSPITIKNYNALLDEFEQFRKTNCLLDIGCGRGWFLQQAQKRGWRTFGTEYSKSAIQLCKNDGIEMKQEPLIMGSFNKESFDIITSFEVMEHLHQPDEGMRRISFWLRKGGLFYCTTPNFNSLMRYYLKTDYNYVITYPEHLSYFTKTTLNQLAINNGLSPLKFLSTGISFLLLKKTKIKENPNFKSSDYNDEKLRGNISSKWHLGLVKKIVNKLLTLTNWGMTLKGYYLKK
jgi:2-polyprenyl-3-methyl-5-hydroxy-6-metoxy-1,4-benzoquinol methylase